ncbi:unnamed protein product [Cercopithifilaria johnstoni]|uniref:Uncharacterized protein n=1 Tax=Cercopithifilaria johnstoni TaxID=2874296 RepID=A0A8J2M5D0_9BILA|nr:unnamed protein product [Cercopithifilaria johnstoni]
MQLPFGNNKSINTPFKKDISPNVGKSQVNFHPPPDISQPNVSYQRVFRGRTDFKYRFNAGEVYRSAKALFTIRNLGRNDTALTTDIEKTAIISDVQKQDTSNSIEYQRTTYSTRGHENEVGISLEFSTTESISTESIETGKEKATDLLAELPHILQKQPKSPDYNEFQQQYVISTSSTLFPTSTISGSTQHQELNSSYLTDPKQSKSEEHKSIVLNKAHEAPQEMISLSNIISKKLPSSFGNNISSFTIDTLSNKTTQMEKISSFSETHGVSENQYGSNIILETSHISESYPDLSDLSTNTVPSLIVISMNHSGENTKSQELAIQHYGDNHQTNILKNTKNSSNAILRATDAVSSFVKQFVKLRIQSLLPFHFSMKNETVVSNNISSSRQISSRQETISRNFTYFGSNVDKSNKNSDNATLVTTTDKRIFAQTNHSLSDEEIPNVTNEKEALDNFEPETDHLQNKYKSKQQSTLGDEYYSEKQHSFSDLDTEDSSDNIAGIGEQNSQNNDIYSTEVFPNYQNIEVIEHSEVPTQLGHTDISEQEQGNKITMSSDLRPSSIDWYSTHTMISAYIMTTTPSPPLTLLTTNGFNDVNGEKLLKLTENNADLALKHSAVDISSGTTQPNVAVTKMRPQVLKEIHIIKQTESSGFSDERNFNINSQLTPSNKLTPSNEDSKEIMSSASSVMAKEMPSVITVMPTSTLAGVHRTEIAIKETIQDNHEESVNWLATSSMKPGKSNQRVTLPISELKMHIEVSDTSGLILDTSTIKTKESSETINISTSIFLENIIVPSSVPLSAATEIPSTATTVHHERTAIDHSIIEKDSEVNLLQHVDEKTSERLLETISTYPKKAYENEKEIATDDYVHYWNSEFSTEVSSPEILHNHSSEITNKIENNGASYYTNNLYEYEGNDGNYNNITAIVSVTRN